MNVYRLTYTQTVTYRVMLDAESESAARQAFIDGDTALVSDHEAIEWADDETLLCVDLLAEDIELETP